MVSKNLIACISYPVLREENHNFSGQMACQKFPQWIIGWTLDKMITVLQMLSRGVGFIYISCECWHVVRAFLWRLFTCLEPTGAKQPGLHYSHLSCFTSVVLLDPLHWVSIFRGNDNLNVCFWPAVCTATTAWQRLEGEGAEGKIKLALHPVLDTVCVCMCVWGCVELVAMVSKTYAHFRALCAICTSYGWC